MKCRLECLEIGMTFEGIENEENMNPKYTREENQQAFFRQESLTYKYEMYKKLDKIIDSGEYTEEEKKNHFQYSKDFKKSIIDYSCGNEYENECEFTGSLSEMLEHEKICFGLRPINNIESNVANKFVKCDLCNKKFCDYPTRKMKLQYQLNQHKKTCRKQYKKKRRRMVIEFLKESADQDIIDSIFNEYKDILILE